MHHALDKVFHQLDVQAEGADAGHKTGELIAHLVRHEAHFFPRHELTLRVVGATLTLRRVSPHVGQIFMQLGGAFLAHALSRLAQ